MFTNCRSFCNKRDELKEFLSGTNPKPTIVSLTETWTNETISNDEIHIPGYNLKARRDRQDTKGGRGGGILVYVLQGISACEEKTEQCQQFDEAVCIQIEAKQGPIDLYTIYRSPNSSPENTQNLLSLLASRSKSRSIFVGDFNYHIDWNNLSSESVNGKDFLECLDDSYLEQFVDFPTRGKNTLDLILAQEGFVTEVRSEGKLGDSDHDMILFNVNTGVILKDSVQFVPNYSKANYNHIKSELRERNWEHDLKFMNAQQAWDHFYNTIHTLLDQHVPMVQRRSRNRPVWSTKTTRKAVKRKQLLWKKFRQGDVNFDTYKSAEKVAKHEIRVAKKNFEKQIASDMNKNPRKFYAYLNCKNKNPTIGPLSDGRGNNCHDPKGMANIFNTTFASVFEPGGEENVEPEQVFCPYKHDELSNITITPAVVLKKLQNLKAHSAPGADGIHPKLLKVCSRELSVPLTIIFQKSMNEGTLPNAWKCTNITPLYKKGSREAAENYRPINCLSVPAKLMEQIIKDQILLHLEQNQLITDAQHGFRQGRSVTTGLLQYLNDVTTTTEDGHSFDTLMTDFRRAFDRVQFKKMLAKLERHGIKGKVFSWIENWMTGRSQRVVLNGFTSDWIEVTSSVVQGSVLGPILFLIFINDLDEAIKKADPKTIVYKFADDTKLGRIVNSEEDAVAFQSAIDSLVEWCENWGMTLHPQKCKGLHFGNKNKLAEYNIQGNTVEKSIVERDLGVLISTDMKFSNHVKWITSKANAVLARIKRTVLYRDKVIFPKLFSTYVRPILETAIPVWNNTMRGDISKVERVQRRALKCISGLRDKPYEERLTICGMQSLEERRKKLELVETFKVLNSDSNLGKQFQYIENRHNHETRSSRQGLLVPPKCKTRARRDFFTNRVVHNWNQLPLGVRNCKKVSQFKNCYDTFLQSQL